MNRVDLWLLHDRKDRSLYREPQESPWPIIRGGIIAIGAVLLMFAAILEVAWLLDRWMR